MSDIYDAMQSLLREGRDAVMATVVRTKGSTPREVGARMLIVEDGAIEGTVGGGCGEAEVWSEAMEVFRTRKPKLIEVDLLHDQDAEGGRACGGYMYVFIEPLSPPLTRSPKSCDNAAQAARETSRPESTPSDSEMV